jgi:hypothetical protein
MREPNGVVILADADALISDLDLWTLSAEWAKGEFDRFHLGLLLDWL